MVDTYKKLVELHDCIKYDELDKYKHKVWLLNTLDYLLCYDERPDDLRAMLFDIMQDLFPYNGNIYHGFISYNTVYKVIQEFKGVLSYSFNLHEAYLYATSTDHMNTNALIMGYTDNGFNFYEFMLYLSNNFKEVAELFAGYKHEREILAYPMLYKVVENCLEKSVDDVRKELGLC